MRLLAALALSALALGPAGGVSPRDPAIAAHGEARAAFARGRMEQAAKAFDKAIALSPKSASLWTDIGRFRLATGNAGGAIEAARYAASLNPENADAVLFSAELTRGQYGPSAALPLFDQALAMRPDHLETLGEMAATLGEAGEAQASLALTRRMLALDRANARAFFLQAVLAARAGRYELARGLAYRTGGRMDGVPAMELLKGMLDVEAGNNEQAVARLAALVKARPLHFPARRLLAYAQWQAGDMTGVAATLMPMARRADADAYTLTLFGRALEAMGNRAAAAELLDRAAVSTPGPSDSFDLASWAGADAANADVMIPRISQLVARGNAAAVELARQVSARNPGSTGAHIALGDALTAGGQNAAAAAAYRQAANLDFSEPIALRLIAALANSGAKADAARAASLYLGQNPRSIPALILAGQAAMATRDWPGAIARAENLRLRIGNRNVGAIANLAWAHFETGDGRRAAMFARRATALAPNNAAIAGSAGFIIARSGDRDAGRALLRKAATLSPGNAEIRRWLSET